MKIIKNNKTIFILLTIILIFVIGAFITFKSFYPSGNEYGNRLKGIDKVKITENDISKWEKKISDNEKIKKVKINVKGRLINIIITVKEDTNLDDMKEHSKKQLEIFTKKQLNYYDIQFYINNEKDKVEHYPAMGYRHKSKDDITWSNN